MSNEISLEDAVKVLNLYNETHPRNWLAWSPENARLLQRVINRLLVKMDLDYLSEVFEDTDVTENLAQAVLYYFGWDLCFLMEYRCAYRIDQDIFEGCVQGVVRSTELHGTIYETG